METIKKHGVVIVAFLLPLILLGGVLVNSYVSAKLVSTEYDFVYATCDMGTQYYPYDCNTYLNALYAVTDNKLVEREINLNESFLNEIKMPFREVDVPEFTTLYKTRIFIHDTGTNESREITKEEAKQLTLRDLLTSPDGVSVENSYDRSSNFFPFFDNGSRQGYYLMKGRKRNMLNLVNTGDRNYYGNTIKFIGWIQ